MVFETKCGQQAQWGCSFLGAPKPPLYTLQRPLAANLECFSFAGLWSQSQHRKLLQSLRDFAPRSLWVSCKAELQVQLLGSSCFHCREGVSLGERCLSPHEITHNKDSSLISVSLSWLSLRALSLYSPHLPSPFVVSWCHCPGAKPSLLKIIPAPFHVPHAENLLSCPPSAALIPNKSICICGRAHLSYSYSTELFLTTDLQLLKSHPWQDLKTVHPKLGSDPPQEPQWVPAGGLQRAQQDTERGCRAGGLGVILGCRNPALGVILGCRNPALGGDLGVILGCRNPVPGLQLPQSQLWALGPAQGSQLGPPDSGTIYRWILSQFPFVQFPLMDLWARFSFQCEANKTMEQISPRNKT